MLASEGGGVCVCGWEGWRGDTQSPIEMKDREEQEVRKMLGADEMCQVLEHNRLLF